MGTQSVMNPAVFVGPVEAGELFDKGFSDAAHTRDDSGAVDRFRRGIGDVRTNMLGSKETVSFVWVFPPRLLAYNWGYLCRRKYEPDDVVNRVKERLRGGVFGPTEQLHVEGHLRILPSRGGMYGALSRRANPKDLEDVRVVMSVGDRIYQPQKAPGGLLGEGGTGTNTFSTPASSSTRTEGSFAGPRGYGNFEIKETTFFTINHEENFKWYAGDFDVVFDVFNPDGSCRITTADKKLEIIVVYGSNERHAVYDLDDFLRP